MRNILLLLLLLSSQLIFSQEHTYSETKDDEYLPMKEEDKKFSPAYSLKSATATIIQVNTEAGLNLLNDAANEPSLAINPINPNEMVIGWRQFDNIQSNFRQAGVAHTVDGGETWTVGTPVNPGVFQSDPVLATNSEGTYFYNTLTNVGDDGNVGFACDVYVTADVTDWSTSYSARGGDKQWMVIDNTETSSNGNIYAFWKESFSSCNGGFTRSFDGGQTFDSCVNLDGSIERGTMTIDVDGTVYVCGASIDHKVMRSTNAKIDYEPTVWDLTKVVDLKGRHALYDGPNPRGMLGQAGIVSDHSQTENRGNIYLLSTIVRTDIPDPADIMFTRSLDQGETWSEAIPINDDGISYNWQWFGTMSVAPNGRIDVVWLDTRDFPGDETYLSSLYYSFSEDGGLNWSYNKRISSEFDSHLGWPNQEKMGDYFHMISTDDHAFLAWAATFNGEQDIYFSKIDPEDEALSNEDFAHDEALRVFPNPFDREFSIDLKSRYSENTQVDVFDQAGRVVSANRYQAERNNNLLSISFNFGETLVDGIYYVRVKSVNSTPQFYKILKQ